MRAPVPRGAWETTRLFFACCAIAAVVPMSVSSLKVGTRVTINGKPQLGTGTVRFVGTTEFQTGLWVGVELDQPGMENVDILVVRHTNYGTLAVGKNDGSVQGTRYFNCAAAHGLFIREKDATPVKVFAFRTSYLSLRNASH